MLVVSWYSGIYNNRDIKNHDVVLILNIVHNKQLFNTMIRTNPYTWILSVIFFRKHKIHQIKNVEKSWLIALFIHKNVQMYTIISIPYIFWPR